MYLFFFLIILLLSFFLFFFFNDTATTEIYTLSLHDALPISLRAILASTGRVRCSPLRDVAGARREVLTNTVIDRQRLDRKSTRLNSSHLVISYAVFCLKKKKRNTIRRMSRVT